ncbi:uncharacterized protein Ecym_4682 [Eremothecium cymbalariae DBVPG|uniref:Alcohol dehydrogenase-like N-terminal domain-containing protein n=1 Tax=Eremothecium cymbalariae (strain CBS 270.75 / DBVPG 7215 / KCTC 17166 / NRRL Y-17582) TaxID=931890 RepID=G8JSI1_ERECY|nr:hypothetical protein Ecym_4682 [Eremothecium cymbalariae DBVPG\
MMQELVSKPTGGQRLLASDGSSPSVPRKLAEPVSMKRVARPLRHIKHIPVKSLKFYSRDHPPQFSYGTKIPLPIHPAKLVVQVQHIGLNPVDLKIMNGYANHLNGEIGFGREYSGVITEVGSDLTLEWKEGDEVMGVFWHPNQGKGVSESSILIDPKVDAIAKVPSNLNMQQASGSLYSLGAASELLKVLDSKGYLTGNSNILLNGGTTTLGLFTIQLLKYHYYIPTKLVVICSSYGAQLLKETFPDIAEELLFIDYKSAPKGDISSPLIDLIERGELAEYYPETSAMRTAPFSQGKFTTVIDFIGGYDIIAKSDSIIAPGGFYITTVGDIKSNYKKDVYKSWDAPTVSARSWFGKMLWSFEYMRFHYDPNLRSTDKDSWLEACMQILRNETVKVLIDKKFDWKYINKAMSYLATGHAHGKVILDVEKF